jgi:hypothetical protein
MAAYQRALETLDVATLKDSLNGTGPQREDAVSKLAIEAHFFQAMAAHFGKEATEALCAECRFLWFDAIRRCYFENDWSTALEPGLATAGVELDWTSPDMQIGADGIWRLGRIVPASLRSGKDNPLDVGDICLREAERFADRFAAVTPGIASRKYATTRAVVDALFPEGSPMAQIRKMQEREKQEEDKEVAEDKAAEEKLLAAHFDCSTLDGFQGVLQQVVARSDLKAACSLYASDNDLQARFAAASAHRMISTMAFYKATQRGAALFASPLPRDFELSSGPEMVLLIPNDMGTEPIAHGDKAILGGLWFRKIADNWKFDLEYPPAGDIAERAATIEEDATAVDGVIARITSGVLRSDAEIRDAVGTASLNAYKDPTFEREMQIPYGSRVLRKRGLKEVGLPPEDAHSPAGGFNRFLTALNKEDETALTDCFYLVHDNHGKLAAAQAHDFVVAVRLLHAVAGLAGNDDLGFWPRDWGNFDLDAVCPRFDEDWARVPEYPTLAFHKIVGSMYLRNGHTRWTPTMCLCSDGLWRIGQAYPESARRLARRVAILQAKDAVVVQVIADVAAGKYPSAGDVRKALASDLSKIDGAHVDWGGQLTTE